MAWLGNLFVKITGYIPQLLVFRTKVYYEDKKVQSRKIKKKAIVMSNHHTIYDVAGMMFVFPFRTLRCLVAELMFKKNFLMTFLLKMLGVIKVERNSHDFSFMNKSLKVLEKGGVIEIYPEARIPDEGEQKPLPFKPSVAHLALTSGAPIIPVYTNGKYFSKERARIIIGKPVDVREWYDDGLDEKQNLALITERLREKVIELKQNLEKQYEQEKKKV